MLGLLAEMRRGEGGKLTDDEINRLTKATEEADRLAASGLLVDGYMVLVAGRHRAEELRDEDWPWGQMLVDHWRQACERYAKRYGVSLP